MQGGGRECSRRAPDADASTAVLRMPLGDLRGIGAKRAAQLAGHGLLTIGDLLYHVPFRYEDRRTLTPIGALRPGEYATTIAEVTGIRDGRVRRWGGRSRFGRVLEAAARDESGGVTLVWFNRTGYFRTRCCPGNRILIHGRVEPGPKFVHPDIDIVPDATAGETGPPGRLLPVYSRPAGIAGALMRRFAQTVMTEFGGCVRGLLPADVVARHGLMDVADALRYLHAPPQDADAEALNAHQTAAHRTLAFDELLCLQLGLGLRRAAQAGAPGIRFSVPGRLGDGLRRHLPFTPTPAQERVLAEIYTDMASGRPMHRLIQGDVGSGKTVVALFAALVALDAGCQAAVMAPTEVLAEQHASTFRDLLEPLGICPLLLTGAVSGRERERLLECVATGEPRLIVGTHALIQRNVTFERLGLAVIDEQHRFGVLQRARLGGHTSQRGKQTDDARGICPDVLVMTATPIPRTLAMTVYGDLDVSCLDQLPPGRQPVATHVVAEDERERAYRVVREALAVGNQAFVVAPLVEDSAAMPLRAATAMATELRRTTFGDYRVGLIHGRMRSDEKDETLRRFKAGAYDVLVCTTIIEVGIDVPNATAMVIEHADRFGLAQLHQLRGRVGRGSAAAVCYLIASAVCPGDGLERLRVMEQTQDGFEISEADLRIRGPGEFLGTRQAGLPEFRVASLLRDTGLLDAARGEADRWLHDQRGAGDAAALVASAIHRHRWADRLRLAEVG